MPIHDAWLRLTPLERVLPDEEFAGASIVPIANEIEQRDVDPGDPGAFAMLESTGSAADALRAEQDGAGERHQLAVLLYHVFHMLAGDRRHTLVSTAAARWAVEAGGGATAAEPAPPAGGVRIESRYVQLPQHLFWVRTPDAETPSSLDGWFRTRVGEDLVIMGVMDVRGPAAGFSVLPLPMLPLADAPAWRSEPIREDGEDFRSDMPGADLEGLYELRTAGELLKLVARLELLESTAAGVVRPLAPPSDAAGGPEPSRLPADLLDLA